MIVTFTCEDLARRAWGLGTGIFVVPNDQHIYRILHKDLLRCVYTCERLPVWRTWVYNLRCRLGNRLMSVRYGRAW